MKAVGAESALRLTSDPLMETSPAWSPDGMSIAFLRVRPPESLEVCLISPLGGRPKKVAELHQTGQIDAVRQPGGTNTHKLRRISWFPGGDALVVQDTPEASEPS